MHMLYAYVYIYIYTNTHIYIYTRILISEVFLHGIYSQEIQQCIRSSWLCSGVHPEDPGWMMNHGAILGITAVWFIT